MTAAHLDEVAAIENDCFSHPWSRRSLESELKNETSHFLVAVEDGKVIGYIGMSAVIDEGYLFNAAVDSHFSRWRYGRATLPRSHSTAVSALSGWERGRTTIPTPQKMPC